MSNIDKTADGSSAEKSRDRLLILSLLGTAFAALCCFTPFLVVLLGIVGLSAVVGYLDVVLLPALGVLVLLTIYAMWRKQRRGSQSQ